MASPATSIDDSTGKGLLLKADPIADTFREEVKAGLKLTTRPPKLVGILSTSSAPSKSYATFTKKQCEDLGFEFVLKLTGAALSSDQGEGDGVEEAIIEANEDDSVDGIMVSVNIHCPSYKKTKNMLLRCIIRFSVHSRFGATCMHS